LRQSWRSIDPVDLVTIAVAVALLGLLLAGDLHGGAYRPQIYLLGALLILGLLVCILAGARGLPRTPARAELVGLGAFAALTAWSYASILWSRQPAEAWAGSSRMLLYLALLFLVMILPWRATTAFVFFSGYVATVVFAGGLALAKSHNGDSAAYLGGRLSYPFGHPAADAVALLTAYWVALIFASRPGLPVVARAGALGAAGILAPLAVLSQSRASVIAFTLTAVLLIAVLPGRLRTVIGLGVTVAPLVVGWDRLTAVRNVADLGGVELTTAADRAIVLIVISGLLLAGVGVLWAVADHVLIVPARVMRAVNIGALGILALALAVGTIAASRSRPIDRVANGWDDFTAVQYVGGFGGGLGSNRYDFFRVALSAFSEHPVLGIGTDNFLVEYLSDRRSTENPRFPHSVEVQLLSQLGLVGAALGALFFGALAFAAFPRRLDDPRAAVVATAALAGGGYWLTHASVDWFWEIPGTFAPTIALLAVGGAVRAGSHEPIRFKLRYGFATGAVATVIAVALIIPLWAERLMQDAASGWPANPSRALAQLGRAGRLNRLSPTPAWLTAQISVELDDVQGAYDAYGTAIDRDPDYWYWHFQRAAAASELGLRTEALNEMYIAGDQNPGSGTVREIERRLVAGKTVGLRLADELFTKAEVDAG
jgi:O-Antigen ligase